MSEQTKAKVIFAGAGPGDPDLITMKAARYLQQADVVLTDRLVSEDILNRYVSAEADIIYVGTALGKYNLHLGGDHEGNRLNKIYKESLDEDAILNELDGLFADFKKERKDNEKFGDFTMRKQLV